MKTIALGLRSNSIHAEFRRRVRDPVGNPKTLVFCKTAPTKVTPAELDQLQKEIGLKVLCEVEHEPAKP